MRTTELEIHKGCLEGIEAIVNVQLLRSISQLSYYDLPIQKK